jgi:hypothetical protein
MEAVVNINKREEQGEVTAGIHFTSICVFPWLLDSGLTIGPMLYSCLGIVGLGRVQSSAIYRLWELYHPF